MAKRLYIPCDIFKRGIDVFCGTLDEFKAWVNDTFTYDDDVDFVKMVNGLEENKIGMASFNYNNLNGTGVILLEKQPETPKEIAALAHEALHATFHMLNCCHVEYCYDGNNETFTYVMEHLMRNALEFDKYEDITIK